MKTCPAPVLECEERNNSENQWRKGHHVLLLITREHFYVFEMPITKVLIWDTFSMSGHKFGNIKHLYQVIFQI